MSELNLIRWVSLVAAVCGFMLALTISMSWSRDVYLLLASIVTGLMLGVATAADLAMSKNKRDGGDDDR